MINYKFNDKKAVEVVLWLAEKSEKTDIYRIVKAIFFADKYHLNKYHRPITGDHYCAMPYGPVPSRTYDLLKGDPLELAELGEVLPFEKDGNCIIPNRTVNTEMLSKSDIKALEHGWDVVKDKSFQELKEITHDIPLYKKAWENRTTDSDLIDYKEFLDDEQDPDEVFANSDNLCI